MKVRRRRFLRLAAGAAALAILPHVAWAQTYPSRPVKLVVGYAAGGVTDILARLMGQWLSERLAQPFIIENRPGAGSNIATEAVVNAPSDGRERPVADGLLIYGEPAAKNSADDWKLVSPSPNGITVHVGESVRLVPTGNRQVAADYPKPGTPPPPAVTTSEVRFKSSAKDRDF